VPGFASLGATAKEAVRAWLQAPAEQWLRAEESERPWPMAITRVHPPPTDDSMDGSGATVRAIAAAATSAVPVPDAAAADDHGDGASTWIPPPRQRKRKRDYREDAKESSHRQWKAFGSDPTRRSMKGIRTVRQVLLYGFFSFVNEHGQVLRFGRRKAMRSTWRPAWQVLDMALWAPHGDARQTQPLHLAAARSLLDAAPCRRADPARGAPSRGGCGLPAGGARPAPTTAPRAHGMHARRGAPLACTCMHACTTRSSTCMHACTTRSSTATLGC